ncbi:ProQ/FINO family protein [Plasticicumulans lactativorans]|uniref:ProQ/FINO family protein n=1 Tax=Plasticicumulans lactativorans TaxID=1133106 RepID=UPI0010434C94|nr:ProQ/FinO family protein [Plasticicumulans lactativorans]
MPSKTRRTAAALDYLQVRFPRAFPIEPAAVRPLAIGTREALATLLEPDPAADAAAAGWALRRWCLRLAYLQSIAAGGVRVALDGNEAGPVDPVHQEAARARLAEREATEQTRRPQRPRKGTSSKPAPSAGKAPTPVPTRSRTPTPTQLTIPTKRKPPAPGPVPPAFAQPVTAPTAAAAARPRLSLRKPKPGE